MAQPPLLRNPQMPVIPPNPSTQNLTPQGNNPPPGAKLNLLSKPDTAIPMTPSNHQVPGGSASATPVPRFSNLQQPMLRTVQHQQNLSGSPVQKPAATPAPGIPVLQRPTLRTVQPQKHLSESPATTLLSRPLPLKQPRLITPTQKTTSNQVSNSFYTPPNTTLPMMPFNDPANGINHFKENAFDSDQHLPDYSLLGFTDTEDVSVNPDQRLPGYSPLDQDSEITQNPGQQAQRTSANPPKLFRLPSALDVKPAPPTIEPKVPVSAGLQGQVLAANFNKLGNPILPCSMSFPRQNAQPVLRQVQETMHVQPHPLQRNSAHQNSTARRQLDTLDITQSARVKLDFSCMDNVNGETFLNDTKIIYWNEEMNSPSTLIDMLEASESDYTSAEKMWITPADSLESTIDSKPMVLTPFANVFGEKKKWTVDLQKVYFGPVTDAKLLTPDSPAAQLGMKLTAIEITNQLASMQVISFLPEQEAKDVLFNRDAFHCPPALLASENLNQQMLKSSGSAVRSGKEKYRQPSNQVSVLLDTLFKCDGNGPTVPVSVLSVSAPALDDKEAATNAINSRPVKFARPEMQTYIDFTSASGTVAPVFNQKNYQIACETIRSHVVKGAQLHSTNQNSSGRVIMCAYGVKAFLSALREVIDPKYGTTYAKIATEIMAQEFAKTVIELRNMGQEVSFSDVSKHVDGRQEFICQDFWDLVNASLQSMGQDPLQSVNGFDSKLGQNWVKKGDLIVNAWDPDSLLGNALKLDNSFDGHLGLRTLIHLIHALACRLFHAPECKPGAQIKIRLK